mmetsp:Transcript_4609/g.13925  ORF Transcript_4609/g.13925 Transcript_4609/m.13925 type:complete len:167 (-) Transcript_4609:4059-4559(-)
MMMLSAARQRVGQVSYRLLRYLSTMRASKEAEEKATNWTLKHEPSIQTQFSSFRLALVSQASILAEGGDTRQVSIAAAYDKPERPVRKMAATAVLSGLSCLDMHCTNAVHKNLHFQAPNRRHAAAGHGENAMPTTRREERLSQGNAVDKMLLSAGLATRHFLEVGL